MRFVGKLIFSRQFNFFDLLWMTVLGIIGGWYLLMIIPLAALSVAMQNRVEG